MTSEDATLPPLRSAGEVQALIRKAVIGASHEAGTAAEVADAARWLLDHGYDGVRIGCQVITGETDPLLALAAVDEALALRGGHVVVRGGDRLEVGVLTGGVCGVAAHALRCEFELLGEGWSVSIGSAGIEGQVRKGPFRLRAKAVDETQPTSGSFGSLPVRVAVADWELLCATAARTHVPSSQSSRATGAGAGLTDND